MNCKLYFYSVIIFLFSSDCLADEAYCYRNQLNNLICEKSIDQIPQDFQNKAFFKKIESTPRALNSESKYPLVTLPNISPSKPEQAPNTELQLNSSDDTIDKENLKPDLYLKNLPSSRNLNYPNHAAKNFNIPNDQTLPRSNNQTNNPKIQIFVAKWCPHCRALENFLKSEKLAYKSFDVEDDELGREVFEQEGGGIPITKINGTTVIGFDERKFKAILEAQSPY